VCRMDNVEVSVDHGWRYGKHDRESPRPSS
jgi:hypothetical protein